MGRLALLTACALLVSWTSALAECMPVKSEVVSLGEKAARFYSERSLGEEIEAEKQRLQASGKPVGRVTKKMACAPFPNLIGADEWRCTGDARVCTN